VDHSFGTRGYEVIFQPVSEMCRFTNVAELFMISIDFGWEFGVDIAGPLESILADKRELSCDNIRFDCSLTRWQKVVIGRKGR
jgi:hypothetical protein